MPRGQAELLPLNKRNFKRQEIQLFTIQTILSSRKSAATKQTEFDHKKSKQKYLQPKKVKDALKLIISFSSDVN